MFFILSNLLALFFVIFFLILLSWLWPPNSPWAPWWQTKPHTAEIICEMTKVSKNSYIVDLGCGTGTALLIAAKKHDASGLGVEIDPPRYWIALVRNVIWGTSKHLQFRREDLFKTDIRQADIIFVYLIPKTLQALHPKFHAELKKGAMIATYVYQIPEAEEHGLELIDKNLYEHVFVYKKVA